MFLVLNDIIAPLSEDAPCGVNIRNDPEYRDRYYRIKDARNLARSMERTTAPGEPLRLAQEWHDVNDLGCQILISASKDIEVLAWLAEAQIRINGFAGLRDVFRAFSVLLERYWANIHSICDEPNEEKLAPLSGLNGVSGEGTLIQALRLAPLIPGAGFGQHTLWDFQLAQRGGEEKRWETLQQAATEAGAQAMTAHLAIVSECTEAFDTLAQTLCAQCGGLAPPGANTRNILQEAAAAIRALGRLDDEASLLLHPPAQNTLGAGETDSVLFQQKLSQAAAIASREEAFMILLSIARYFRCTEPNSPLSMALETLVRRGRMDFSELLTELLPEAPIRDAMLTAAGIHPIATTKEGLARN